MKTKFTVCTFQQRLEDWFLDGRNERWLKPVGPVWSCAVAALAVACLELAGASALGAVESVYGSYLANDTFGNSIGLYNANKYTMNSGDAVALHFKIFQNAPYVNFQFDEIKVALSRGGTETWTGFEQITLEICEGAFAPMNSPRETRYVLNFGDSPPDSFPYFTDFSTSGDFSSPTLFYYQDYWIVVRFTSTDTADFVPHTLNWHYNAAGVHGDVGTLFAMGGGTWIVSPFDLQPVVKVRGNPISEPCPESSFLYGAIYGPPYSDTGFQLHTELFCPPATLKYYSCANVVVPANTSSYDAAGIMVQAINSAPQCGGGLPFHAEQSGNVVRVSQSDCPCAGAYVCADPAGILDFAKSMGYKHDGIAMKENLFLSGLASGVSADPLIPAGIQITHWVHSHTNRPPQVFNAFYSPGAGTAAADVAKGIETQLRLQGDFSVTAVGEKLRLDATLIDTEFVAQSSLVENGTLSIQSQGPVGQTFAASGQFNYVDLRTYDGGGSAGATLQVKIFQNTIGGTLLGTSDPVDLPNGWASPTPVRFYFPSGVSVPQASTPVLQVVVTAGDPWLVASGPDSYPSGTAIVQGQTTPQADLWFSVGTLVRSPGGYFDVAYRINDTDLLWAFAPFDNPDPFVLFGTVLRIQRVPPASVRLLWPTNDATYILQCNTNLTMTNWIATTPSPVIVGANYVVTNTIGGAQKYYRLRKP